jgi:hypothetical protein
MKFIRNLRHLTLVGMTGLALLVAGCEKDNNSPHQNARTQTSSGSGSGSGSSGGSGSHEISSGWGVSHYSGTGIIPASGEYNFSAEGNFEVTSGGSISFSRDGYAHYSVPVNNGAFYYKNGLLVGSDESSDSGNMYPTDGFCIGGHFTSSSNAEGSISYASAGEITDGPVSFTATKK